MIKPKLIGIVNLNKENKQDKEETMFKEYIKKVLKANSQTFYTWEDQKQRLEWIYNYNPHFKLAEEHKKLVNPEEWLTQSNENQNCTLSSHNFGASIRNGKLLKMASELEGNSKEMITKKKLYVLLLTAFLTLFILFSLFQSKSDYYSNDGNDIYSELSLIQSNVNRTADFKDFWIRNDIENGDNRNNNNNISFQVTTYATIYDLEKLCVLWTSAILNDIDLRIFSSFQIVNPNETKSESGKSLLYGGKTAFLRSFLSYLSESPLITESEKVILFLDAHDTFLQCSASEIGSLRILKNKVDPKTHLFRGVLFGTESNQYPPDQAACNVLFGKYNNPEYSYARKQFIRPRYINSGITFANTQDWERVWNELEQRIGGKGELVATNDQWLAHCVYLKGRYENKTHAWNEDELEVSKDDFSDLGLQVWDILGNAEVKFRGVPYIEGGKYRYTDKAQGGVSRDACILHLNGPSKSMWGDKYAAYFEEAKFKLTRRIVKDTINNKGKRWKTNWVWDIGENRGIEIDYDKICTKQWADSILSWERYGSVLKQFLADVNT